MDFIRLNAAILLMSLLIEFTLVDRLIVTSSIFRKKEMDTLYLSENIDAHSHIFYRISPVLVGVIASNILVLMGGEVGTAILVSFPFIAVYTAMSLINYRKQIRRLRQRLSGPAGED